MTQELISLKNVHHQKLAASVTTDSVCYRRCWKSADPWRCTCKEIIVLHLL